MPSCFVLFRAAALVLAFLTTAHAADSATSGLEKTDPVALTVNVVTPARETWSDRVRADGSLAAWQEAVVASEIAGLPLTAVLVDVGDVVKRGQELAQVDASVVQAELDQAQAAVAEAEAALGQAVSDAERASALRGSGVLSEQTIAQYDSTRRGAEAKLAAARAALVKARISMDHTRIVAPDDGVILSRSATLGAVTQQGGELFRLLRQNRIEWQAEVVSRDALRLAPGLRARLTLPDGSPLTGTVRLVAPSVDVSKRTALVYVALEASRARPGMFASGEIEIGTEQAVLTVPAEAVVVRDGHALVLCVDAASHVHETRVTTGRRQQGRVEITGGLASDARVIATGAAFLQDGDTVDVR